MPAFTSDDLVARIRREARLPDASDILASDLLALADEEILTLIGDRIKARRAEHWVVIEDHAVSQSVTNNVPLTYDIPRRAFGRMLRSITMVTAQGAELPMIEIDPAQGWQGVPVPRTYYFQDDKIVCAPLPGYTIRFRYLRRPSQLVAVSEGAAISSATNSTSIVVTNAPSWLTAFSGPFIGPGPFPTAWVDVVRGDAPFSLSYFDLALSAYSAPTVTFDSSTPIDTADFVDLGAVTNARQDYLCDRDQTVYPQLPEEMIPVLVSACVRRVLEEIRDAEGAAIAQTTLLARQKAAQDIIAPRNEQGARKLVNRFSPLRTRPFGWRRWR